MSNKQQNQLNQFIQIFTESITNTLVQTLDNDICKKIQYFVKEITKINNLNDIDGNNVLCKIDYATGNRNGSMSFLFEEELIASLTDILMGGDGKNVYKGSITELELNSMSKFLTTIFKNIENDFKQYYDYNFVFSPNFSLVPKNSPDFDLNSNNTFFDILVEHSLVLNDDQAYKVLLLSNTSVIEGLSDDLGVQKMTKPGHGSGVSLSGIKLLSDIKINITAELGHTQVPIKYALELVRGSVVELETLKNSDIKVFANGVEFAKAQVVAVEDCFGLKITKIKSKEGAKQQNDLTTAAITQALAGQAPAPGKKETKEQPQKSSKPKVRAIPVNTGEWLEKIKKKVHEMITSAAESVEGKPLTFDEQKAKKIADYCFTLGVLSDIPDNMLDELQQSAYCHGVGIVTLQEADLADRKGLKKKIASASYDMLSRQGFSQEIADTARFCVNRYKSSAFELKKPIPYHHIVAIVSYYEDLLEQNLSKKEALDSMLQSGGNKFNIFVLHKFLKIMREKDD